jgi:hypothetical protein
MVASCTVRLVLRSAMAPALLAASDMATAQTFHSGAWDVTSTVVTLSVPGVPGFLQRMAQGRSKAEHKRLAPGQGIEALLAPDPKARCTVDGQRAADGRYQQMLTCPQKRGDPLRIVRAGTYGAEGFDGRATVDGVTPKGLLHIVLDQRARRMGS